MGRFVLILCAALGGAAIAVFWFGGAADVVTRPETIRAWVLSAGAWGPLAFIALAMGLFTVFLLAPPVWVSVTIWPLPEAFLYSFVASLLASFVTYGAARRWGADWGAARIPDGLRKWEAKVQARPVRALFSLRLLLWANPLVDLFAAVARVPLTTYLATSAVGLAIATGGQIAIGLGGVTVLGLAPWWVWVALGVVAVPVALWWRRRAPRHTTE